MTEDTIVYLAAPLFSQVERTWNRSFRDDLETRCPEVRIVLPQDFRIDNKYNDSRHFGAIFGKCVEALSESDAVIALLDGADVDSGVAFEVGLAFARDIPVIGVRTDYREGADKGVNLMVRRACRYFVREFAFQEDVGVVGAAVARRLRRLVRGLEDEE